jgi:uncharacterized protein YbjT (DUF2867 family)
MENWTHVAGGALESGTLYYALARRIPQVATPDIGKVAARLLAEGPPKQARVVNLAGPADLTLEDTAAALAKVANKPIAAVSIPPSAMAEALVGMGTSRELADLYGQLSDWMNTGTVAWQGDVERGSITLEQRLGQLLTR